MAMKKQHIITEVRQIFKPYLKAVNGYDHKNTDRKSHFHQRVLPTT
jgi:hypothetical protein